MTTADEIETTLKMLLYHQKVNGPDDSVELDLDATLTTSFLGDARSGAENKIPPSSYYGLLPRLPIQDLPGIHSADQEFGTAPGSAAAKKAFRKIYEGNCTLSAKRNIFEGSTVFCTISASIKSPENGNNSDGRGFVGTLICLSFDYKHGTKDIRMMHHTGFHTGNDKAELFVTTLRENQRASLYSRLVHLFLRTLGSWLEPEEFHHLAGTLEVDYTKNGWRKEFHDLAIIRADVSYNSGLLAKHGVHTLVRVAETMEALTKFETASLLYQDIFSFHWTPKDPMYTKAQLLNMAAVSMGHANKFKESEILLLRSLHAEIASKNRRWDHADGLIVNNAVKSYFAWIQLEPEAWNKIHSYPVALLSLLLCAEAKLGEDMKAFLPTKLARDPKDPLASARVYLKAKVSTKKGAQKALSSAMAHFRPDNPNVHKFRNEIVKHCTSQHLEMRTHLSVNQQQTAYNRMRKDLSKTYVRTDAKVSATVACGYLTCGKAFDSDKLMRCPCHTTYYCGKACQVADWKEHKTVCPWKLRQKAKNST